VRVKKKQLHPEKRKNHANPANGGTRDGRLNGRAPEKKGKDSAAHNSSRNKPGKVEGTERV